MSVLQTRKYNALAQHRIGNSVLSDNPSVWWRFEESSGSTFADSSGNNHPITLQPSNTGIGGTPIVKGSTYSWAPVGTSQAVIPVAETWMNTASWSVEFWTRHNAGLQSPGEIVISRYGVSASTEPGWHIWRLSSGGISLQHPNGSITSVDTPPVMALGIAYHVVVSFDLAGFVRIYINGGLQVTSPSYILPVSNYGMMLGGSKAGINGTPYYPYKGMLDDFAYYGYALSPQRITAHYDGGRLT